MNLIEFAKYREQLKAGPLNVSETVPMSSFAFTGVELPVVKMSKKYDWVEWGGDNEYPQYLLELFDSSAIHGAIVGGTGTMVAGGELLLNGATLDTNEAAYNALSPTAKGAVDAFVQNGDNDDDIYVIKSKIALDYMIYGSFALEVLWTKDKSKISQVRYVDVSRVRSGKKVDGKVDTYYYSEEWSNKRSEKIEFDAFDESNPGGSQLLYVKNHNPGQDYYGRPKYLQGIQWISTDANLASYHNSNVNNGFNPSMSVKFYNVPDDPEKRRRIVTGIHTQFQGIRNTGKAMVFFSDDKDTAPDVNPIQVNNLDKQYIALATQCVQQIMSTHRVTHPLLFGVQTPGQLGSGGDLETAFKIYDKTVVTPDRDVIEKTLNRILSVNTQEVTIKLDTFNPLA